MKRLFNISFVSLLALGAFVLSACFNDLNVTPLDPDEVTAAVVYDDETSYKRVLAKLYAGLALSGQQGPAGQPDIGGIDEGFSTYLRQYWKAQELSTDEAVIAWNDGNIHDYHQQDWDANNEFITAMYNRIFYQISLCNEFIRETTDEKLTERGVTDPLLSEIAIFRAEARFLRALSYWHALDMFRSVPFVTEADAVGSFFPQQISPEALFAFIETEGKELESLLIAPQGNEYGRADQAAVWMLLAKLYLNAEVYINQAKYTECLDYCKKVIDAGYSLEADYANLFLADNHTADGIIFPVNFDGEKSRTWGGMTFIIHAAVGGSMNPTDFGIDGGWGGTRVTSAFVDKFPSIDGGEPLVEPNPGDSTYELINVPGSYQGWDPANDSTTVASVLGDNTYEGYFYFNEAGTKFKFAKDSWSINWGDDQPDGVLEADGADIEVADPGYYKINLDLNDSTYSLTKTDWGLIGSATPGGWDNDTDMTFDESTGAWTLTVDLEVGEVKFRANDAWDINLGDDVGNAILTQDGGNISIPSAGTYKIELYLGHPDYTYKIERPSFDGRAMFYTQDQSLEIEDISQFSNGYAITKFKNITSDGIIGSDLTFPDTDFPMFRLADTYLMYAEAVLRGGSGGDLATATGYVNQILERAYGGSSGNIDQADLDLDFILDERSRELYWECHRRTDLVRFGRFSATTYLWPWKGGVAEGVSTDEIYDIFPIPASDIGANPQLTQNTGY